MISGQDFNPNKHASSAILSGSILISIRYLVRVKLTPIRSRLGWFLPKRPPPGHFNSNKDLYGLILIPIRTRPGHIYPNLVSSGLILTPIRPRLGNFNPRMGHLNPNNVDSWGWNMTRSRPFWGRNQPVWDMGSKLTQTNQPGKEPGREWCKNWLGCDPDRTQTRIGSKLTRTRMGLKSTLLGLKWTRTRNSAFLPNFIPMR